MKANVNHKWREYMILPYCAISDNIPFLISKEDKYIITSDGYVCKCEAVEQKHICELEDEIQKTYGLDAWAFIKRWHKVHKTLDSMWFVTIRSKKVSQMENV